ncbi:UPF0481 protein At3g47200-like [Diospyros lotus]|uniref:UPF0481 protein At3g47200-like n=1 Tax=Diospyros lotus TaxID=55363 RepID=UPI00224DAF52|nr:UPF0481 protein At3g47200-like [Diospyros lotus]
MDHCVLEAELDNLGNAQSQEEQSKKKPSIYKIPPVIISDHNKKAYQPQSVSFGPYHHGEPRLKPMEDHKQRAFYHFLKRSLKPQVEIFDSMVEVAQELKDSYGSLEPKWQDDTKKFVTLMIVDECFILEILRVANQPFESDYSNDDPIFGYHGMLYAMPFIRRDMLLLENQLPMLVLVKLKCFEENVEYNVDSTNMLILNFFGFRTRDFERGKSLHILDLYRQRLLVKRSKPTERNFKRIHNQIVPLNLSATMLIEGGIRFRRSEGNSPMDISFDGGILRLPKFVVNDTTESTFLNLMAFERCNIGVGHAITSFICFMGNIIYHDRDISLLSSERIIVNFVGTDKVAANLFHTMSKDLVIDPSSHLNLVTVRMASYWGKPWPKWRAELTRTYFRNPWATVSVIAAVILFALTILQTGFTVYDLMLK